MLADAALPSSPDGTASAARGETEKEGAAELEQIQAKLQETIAGFERFGEEAGPRENELEVSLPSARYLRRDQRRDDLFHGFGRVDIGLC